MVLPNGYTSKARRTLSALALAASLIAVGCSAGTNLSLPSTNEASQSQATTSDQASTEAAGTAGNEASTASTGLAIIPRDLCQQDGQLVTNVFDVDDIKDIGIPWTDAFVGKAIDIPLSVPNYPEIGKVRCEATLGVDGDFDFLSVNLFRDGDNLAARYTVRETHEVAGTTLTIYNKNGDSERRMVAEVTFPDASSQVGAASLVFGLESDVSDDAAATILLATAQKVLPQVTFDPPASTAVRESPAATPPPASGPAIPDWWFGCDSANFAIEGFDATTVFAALGQGPATSVKLSDNPLGGLFTECRASNDSTLISVVAVPPIGGFLESVDDVAASEPNVDVRDIAGRRAAVWTDTDGLWPIGKVHLDIDGFTLEIHVEDRDDNGFSDDELRQIAVTAAETLLAQI